MNLDFLKETLTIGTKVLKTYSSKASGKFLHECYEEIEEVKIGKRTVTLNGISYRIKKVEENDFALLGENGSYNITLAYLSPQKEQELTEIDLLNQIKRNASALYQITCGAFGAANCYLGEDGIEMLKEFNELLLKTQLVGKKLNELYSFASE